MLRESNCKIYSLQKNKKHYDNVFYREYILPGSPDVTILKNGVILPRKRIDGVDCGGVCTENLEFFTGLARMYAPLSNVKPGYGEMVSAYPIGDDEIFNSDEEVIFGGVLIGHFGHMLVEGVSRLWWIIQNSENTDKIIFINAGGTIQNQNYVYDILELCNIPRERIVILEKPMRFKRIIVPGQALYMANKYYHDWITVYRLMVKNALAKVGNKKFPSKVYLTKRFYQGPGNCTSNEIYFEQFYKNKGFEVLAPEDLSVTDMVALSSQVDEMATISGTPAFYVLFMKDGATMNMLIKNKDYLSTSNLISFCAKRLLQYNIIDVGLSFLPLLGVHGVFFLGATPCWKEYVKEHFGGWSSKDEMPAEAYEQYLHDWVDYYYEHPDRFRHDRVDFEDGFDIFKKLCEILNDKTVKREDYSTHEEISKLLSK